MPQDGLKVLIINIVSVEGFLLNIIIDSTYFCICLLSSVFESSRWVEGIESHNWHVWLITLVVTIFLKLWSSSQPSLFAEMFKFSLLLSSWYAPFFWVNFQGWNSQKFLLEYHHWRSYDSNYLMNFNSILSWFCGLLKTLCQATVPYFLGFALELYYTIFGKSGKSVLTWNQHPFDHNFTKSAITLYFDP